MQLQRLNVCSMACRIRLNASVCRADTPVRIAKLFSHVNQGVVGHQSQRVGRKARDQRDRDYLFVKEKPDTRSGLAFRRLELAVSARDRCFTWPYS